MPQRNGYRSQRGTSAVARKAMFSGPGKTDGMMPQTPVRASNGEIIGPGRWFGGPMKGGSPPSATGFMTASGRRAQIAVGKAPPASRPNFLFKMRTNPGPRPFGNAPHA